MSFSDILKPIKLCCYKDRVTHASALLLVYSRPRKGYSRVLELGSGNGIVSIGIAKFYNANVVGIEIQKELVEAAKRSAELNHIESKVSFINADVKDIKKIITAESFDMVVSNPPHHLGKIQSKEKQRALERSLNEKIMKSFIHAIKWSLKNGGYYVLVLSPENLIEWIWNLREAKLEPKRLVFFHPRKNKNAELVVVKGRKNGKAGLIVEYPILEG